MTTNQLPTDGQNGFFDGRETYLAKCRCENPKCDGPTSYFADNHELCREQTIELRDPAYWRTLGKFSEGDPGDIYVGAFIVIGADSDDFPFVDGLDDIQT